MVFQGRTFTAREVFIKVILSHPCCLFWQQICFKVSLIRLHTEGFCFTTLGDRFQGDYPIIIQYADDKLLFLQADVHQLFALKCLLRSFADSTGLQINFAKSLLVPINVSEEKAQHLARTFGCVVGSLPFTYLGLPLGTTRPTVTDFLPLICRIERRLDGLSFFMILW